MPLKQRFVVFIITITPWAMDLLHYAKKITAVTNIWATWDLRKEHLWAAPLASWTAAAVTPLFSFWTIQFKPSTNDSPPHACGRGAGWGRVKHWNGEASTGRVPTRESPLSFLILPLGRVPLIFHSTTVTVLTFFSDSIPCLPLTDI